ncbi:MAG: Arc family DNA-binding protein [Planctomycetes bacterium]|nr:Arc family DNA-binding protein [Planctomycetota bacterium]
MSAITIRGLDEPMLSKIKLRAARNRRSMNAEILDVLEQTLKAETPRSLNITTVAIDDQHLHYNRDEIYGDDGR